MRCVKYAALLGVLLFAARTAHAQVSVGVGIGPVYGPAPSGAYGYYGYYPYACAPDGYYGPDWFVGGVFIGTGPWYHGFYGPRFYGRGYYGRGYYGHGYYGRSGYGYYGRGYGYAYRSGYGNGPGYGNRSVYGGSYRGAPGRGYAGGGYHGNVAGGFHGGSSLHGGGGHR